MQNFKPVELEDVYRLFNLGATSLVSAADGDDVDVMGVPAQHHARPVDRGD